MNPAYSSSSISSKDTFILQEGSSTISLDNNVPTRSSNLHLLSTSSQQTRSKKHSSSQLPPPNLTFDKNWARKLFFMTADLIYPGLKNAFEDESTSVERRGISVTTSKVGTSILVQTILNASFLLFLVWIGFYSISIQSMFLSLKAVHAKIYCIIFATFIITNFVRLCVGSSGNKSDNTPKLAAYWLTTCLLQPPQLIFLILTNILISKPFYHLIAVDSLMIGIIIIEALVVFFRVRLLVQAELHLLRRETERFKIKR